MSQILNYSNMTYFNESQVRPIRIGSRIILFWSPNSTQFILDVYGLAIMNWSQLTAAHAQISY